VPAETVNDETVVVRSLAYPAAARVEAGAIVAVIETSKAAIELPAPAPGFIRYTAAAGSEIAVGTAIAYLCDSAELAATEQRPATQSSGTNGVGPRISTKARALMESAGVDAALFAGQAMVREEDVRRILQTGGDARHAKPAAAPPAVPFRREPLS